MASPSSTTTSRITPLVLPSKPATTPNRFYRVTCSSVTAQPQSAKQRLLSLISDQDRGVKTQADPARRASIVQAIDDMAELGRGATTTGPSLSTTWRLLWTTEKEQLFIIDKAPLLGTRAGDVLQVIDVEAGTLNNVITFPPHGVFFVRSSIEVASPQRVNFRFTSAVLRGKDWEFPLPPFGQGWFETVYLDDDIRVVKDIRGDYLVVDRAPYSWKEMIFSCQMQLLFILPSEKAVDVNGLIKLGIGDFGYITEGIWPTAVAAYSIKEEPS